MMTLLDEATQSGRLALRLGGQRIKVVQDTLPF